MNFYICKTCGNLVGMVKESGTPLMCCGTEMVKANPGTSDGAPELHFPLYSMERNRVSVSVGAAAHPMEDNHYIEWIALETLTGVQQKCLKPGDPPTAVFSFTEDDAVVAVYAYCSLHGLWKA